MVLGWGGGNWAGRIERVAATVNTRLRAKRKRPKGSGRPVGPKLVKGRGLLRRRPESHIGVLVYLLVAAGVAILIGKYILIPILP